MVSAADAAMAVSMMNWLRGFGPMSTTSFLPRVMPVQTRLRCDSKYCCIASDVITTGNSDPCDLWMVMS